MSGQKHKQPDETAQPVIEISQGTYWRARRGVKPKGETDRIPAGRVLLLKSIRDVDKQAHTIILRGHPSEFQEHYTDIEYRFLVDEFLSAFEFVPDEEAAVIRQQELAGVQGRVEEIQQRIALAAKNPEAMKSHVDAGIKKWEKEEKVKVGSTASLPVPSAQSVALVGLTEQGVQNMKLALRRAGVVADLQGQWMKEQSTALATTIREMTPFFAERAAAALAKTEDVRLKIDQLYQGIASLDLYVGRNVDVVTIRKGASADPEVPLTIKQSKLYMDEELSVWCDIGEEFDFHSTEKFFERLAMNNALIEQIFPTQRCVICMAVRRHNKDYGSGTDAWTEAIMNQKNKEVFLLVRDGGNIHQVWSPIESHLRAGRLFPTRQEMDDIFTESGWNWETHETEKQPINFMDVRYTDKLSEHEHVALHYKRFLILMAGLDHRLDLFGKFYNEPKGLNFISQRFVNKYMTMISDDEVNPLQLPGERMPDFSEWLASRNEFLRSGSRVMGFWGNCMTQESAPGAYERENWRMREGPRRQYDPVDDFSVIVAFREGKNIMVKVPVEGETVGEYKKRTFDASVNLSVRQRDYGFTFLVLDAVKAADLDYYIHNRIERQNHVAYIRLFKHAAEYLRREEAAETAPRGAMLKALADGGIASGDEALEIVDKAVIAYRAAKRGAELPAQPDRDLLDQMFEIAKGERRVEQALHYAMDNHLTPLRLAVTGKSVLHLYCAPRPDERDDRIFPHPWVKCLTLYAQQKGLGLSNTTWKCLPLKDATETILKEWPGVQEWTSKQAPVSHADKQRWLQKIDESFTGKAAKILGPLMPGEWEERFQDWKSHRRHMQAMTRKNVVQNPGYAIPVGLMYKEPGKEGEAPTLRMICIGTSDAAYWLYHTAPTDAQRTALVEEYAQVYKMKQSARERLQESTGQNFYLCRMDPALDGATEYGILASVIPIDAKGFDDLEKAIAEYIKERNRYESRSLTSILGEGWAGWRTPTQGA